MSLACTMMIVDELRRRLRWTTSSGGCDLPQGTVSNAAVDHSLMFFAWKTLTFPSKRGGQWNDVGSFWLCFSFGVRISVRRRIADDGFHLYVRIAIG